MDANKAVGTEVMSLMYTRNNKGPRMLPWGTPDVTLIRDEVASLMVAYCLWSKR